MQGALIVSADPVVRRSLAAVLQPGRAVSEAKTMSECLARAAAERFDFIFIDGIFADGTSEELAFRLNGLGYELEIIPVLLSQEELYEQPFRQYGVRCTIGKPFNVQQVKQVTEQVEEIARLSDKVIRHAQESVLDDTCEVASPTPFPQTSSEIDVREVSQRFRRLLARLQSREDLVRAFADSLQEQFDVDNVIVLLPATGRPVYEIGYGDVLDEVRSQFFLPFNDSLLKSLIRLGEPVWVYDCERLGRINACAAIRCGERLNIQILCPVLYRGRLKAVIGLSRLHRYTNNPALLSLLRLFLTFFAEALENSYLYEKVAADGEIHRAILEAFGSGMVAVSSAGMITYANPAAESLLGLTNEELLEQPVEKVGSIAAHHARTCLEEGKGTESESVSLAGETVLVSAMPLVGKGGVFLTFCREEKTVEPSEVLAYPQTLDSGKGKLRCIPTPFRKGFFLIRRRP